MAVPTSGNFEMFGTGSTTSIAGALNSAGDNVNGLTTFTQLINVSTAGKFNFTYAGEVTHPPSDINQTYQFRGYPVDPGNCRAIWVDDTVNQSRYGARFRLPSGQQKDTLYGSLFGSSYTHGGNSGTVYNVCSTLVPSTWDSVTQTIVDLGGLVVNFADGGNCYTNVDCEWVAPPVVPTPTPVVPTPTPVPADNVFGVERVSDGFSTYAQLAQGYGVSDIVTLSNDPGECYEIMFIDYVVDPSIYPTITGACVPTPTPVAPTPSVPTPTPVVPTPTPVVPTPTPGVSTYYAEYRDCGDPTAPPTYFYRLVNNWKAVINFGGICVEFVQTVGPQGTVYDYDNYTKYDNCEACSPTPTPTVPTPSVPTPSVPTPSVPTPTPVVPTPTPSVPTPTPSVPTPTPVVPTPSAPTCIAITNQLGYSSVDSTSACNATPARYRADANTLASATVLYNSTDCSSIAPAGYYSDQTQSNWRYWNGTSFSSFGICDTY